MVCAPRSRSRSRFTIADGFYFIQEEEKGHTVCAHRGLCSTEHRSSWFVLHTAADIITDQWSSEFIMSATEMNSTDFILHTVGKKEVMGAVIGKAETLNG